MTRVLVLLQHIGHTTISYEITARLATKPDLDVTVISYRDRSVEEIEVELSDDLSVITLGRRSRFDRRALRRLYSILHSGEYDLLHTHHNFIGSVGRAFAPRDMVVVDTQHANHRDHYSLPQNLVNAPTFPLADCVVANSEATRRSFYAVERALLFGTDVRVIYNGVDVDRIDRVLDGDNPFEMDHRRVTTVGRMIETKNQGTLIRAFDAIADRVPDAHLTLVGDGPARERLESLVTRLGRTDRIEFTGTVDREDVYRILDASELFVLPSRSEGFCVAGVEAMACGLPVVVSDIDVLHEIVGDAGAFADPDDPTTFAARMRSLLTDEEKRRRSARRARGRARTEFPLDRTVDEYHRLYTSLAGR